jgi:hypothetical protein
MSEEPRAVAERVWVEPLDPAEVAALRAMTGTQRPFGWRLARDIVRQSERARHLELYEDEPWRLTSA